MFPTSRKIPADGLEEEGGVAVTCLDLIFWAVMPGAKASEEIHENDRGGAGVSQNGKLMGRKGRGINREQREMDIKTGRKENMISARRAGGWW